MKLIKVLVIFILVVAFFMWLVPNEDSGQRCGDNAGTIYGACNP